MSLLENRVCIVTGAAKGIGEAIVRAFAAEGAFVVATDVDLASLRSVVDSLPSDHAVAVAHDVSSETQWANVVDMAARRFGALDVLVNNAGLCIYASIEEMTLDQWKALSAVNLEGAFLGTKYGIQAMKDPARRKDRSASIINMSSVGGLRGSANLAAYCATKGGIRLFSKAAAAECGPFNIRVNSIHPGVIDTDMGLSAIRQRLNKSGGDLNEAQSVGATNPLGRIGTTTDVANMAVYLASDASSFVTGAEFVVDGGLTAR
jgi:NAD(P)-dependent dehydrogenase (short-subunit alcohol dehydrogenase family)